MNISVKIKEARLNAGLTQEQAAEALSVSRQTVSNWENGKTYPDIVSVIKMSDLYSVSLDRLLKDDGATEDYIDYLEKSTDTVKSRAKLSATILISTYLVVFAFALLTFWVFMSPTDSMGFSIVFLMLVLPILTFVTSVIVSKNDFLVKGKWLMPLILGIAYMLSEYATFSLSNMIAFSKLNPPQIEMLFAGAAISLIGLLIGLLLKKGTKGFANRPSSRDENNFGEKKDNH